MSVFGPLTSSKQYKQRPSEMLLQLRCGKSNQISRASSPSTTAEPGADHVATSIGTALRTNLARIRLLLQVTQQEGNAGCLVTSFFQSLQLGILSDAAGVRPPLCCGRCGLPKCFSWQHGRKLAMSSLSLSSRVRNLP